MHRSFCWFCHTTAHLKSFLQGYGEHKQKSSTTAQEVKTLEGAYIHTVSCGFGHALVIARNDTDAEKEAIGKLPLYTPGS